MSLNLLNTIVPFVPRRFPSLVGQMLIGLMLMSQMLVGLLAVPRRAAAEDWLTWPSTYTHHPYSGQRVDQFALSEQPLSQQRSDFTRSGFRHFRSTLQAGQSADNMHIVEQWGRPVVPYEQWRFPFRPFGVPYDAWGPQAPYGIINGSFGWNGPGPGQGRPGYGTSAGPFTQPGEIPADVPPYPNWPNPSQPWGNGMGGQSGQPSRGFPLTPTYGNEPWFDGTYPSAPPLDSRGGW
jgi:hypothetical protein